LLSTLPVVAVLYLLDPAGSGAIAYTAVALGSVIAIAVGPLVHRPPRPLPWRLLLAASSLFLVGVVLRSLVTTLGGAGGLLLAPDLWTLIGFGFLGSFLLTLLRASGPSADPAAAVDAVIAGLGAAVMAWAALVAPTLSPDAPGGVRLLDAVYPVIDVLLVGLALQLSFRRRTDPTAFRLMNAGLLCTLIGDLGYAARAAGLVRVDEPNLAIFFLAAYVLMGATALHPSIRSISAGQRDTGPAQLSRLRRFLLCAVLFAPGLVPLLWPEQSMVDRAVRAVLWASLAAMVVTRLMMTVSRLRRAEETATRQASHDSLTALPNRAALMREITRRVGNGHPSSILFVDFDDFKGVNDTLGHPVGDQVLIASAQRLRDAVGPGDVVARVGGDEFVIVTDTGGPEQLSEALRQALAKPFEVPGGREISLTASVGVAGTDTVTGRATVGPAADTQADELLSNADLAMYHVKTTGRDGHAVFNEEMRIVAIERVTMARALREALTGDELSVHFQPIKSVCGGGLIGFEALVRWNSPEYGAVPPIRFIPLAEEMGIIVDLGRWVLGNACRATAEMLRGGGHGLHVSVNVSPLQLTTGDLPATVAAALADSGLPAEALWLEITESAMVENDVESMEVFQALRAMGVKLAVDDFGTGYSSLSYLKRLPVQVIKVDRSFVIGLGDDPQDEALVEAMVQLAHALDMSVVAEGVETAVQAGRLEALGCDLVQGYYFGRPAPSMEVCAADGIGMPTTAGVALRQSRRSA
jgi:diguanylate cyclase (GGDEF)-like protein